jgi:hypothetical protein
MSKGVKYKERYYRFQVKFDNPTQFITYKIWKDHINNNINDTELDNINSFTGTTIDSALEFIRELII